MRKNDKEVRQSQYSRSNRWAISPVCLGERKMFRCLLVSAATRPFSTRRSRCLPSPSWLSPSRMREPQGQHVMWHLFSLAHLTNTTSHFQWNIHILTDFLNSKYFFVCLFVNLFFQTVLIVKVLVTASSKTEFWLSPTVHVDLGLVGNFRFWTVS